MSPKHSIDFCPVCGGGLCGIRLCGLDGSHDDVPPHGLIVCDECEAIWLVPDVTSDHSFPSAEDARCPVCCRSLWGDNGRWADQSDIESLGWQHAVRHELDCVDEQAS